MLEPLWSPLLLISSAQVGDTQTSVLIGTIRMRQVRVQYSQDHYDWKSANITEQRPIVGRYATYPGDGFLYDLGLNLTGAQTRLRELQYWKWMDDRTRPGSQQGEDDYCMVADRILFEFPAAGGVLIRQEAPANSMGRSTSPTVVEMETQSGRLRKLQLAGPRF
eukprot:Skav231050  [mRNA]  locus=scaffold2842:60963:64032:+ [translate_table: standard]